MSYYNTTSKDLVVGSETMKQNKKSYLIIWTYCANYGCNIMEGYSEKEVIKQHPFYKREDISLVACDVENVLVKTDKKGNIVGSFMEGLLKEVRK